MFQDRLPARPFPYLQKMGLKGPIFAERKILICKKWPHSGPLFATSSSYLQKMGRRYGPLLPPIAYLQKMQICNFLILKKCTQYGCMHFTITPACKALSAKNGPNSGPMLQQIIPYLEKMDLLGHLFQHLASLSGKNAAYSAAYFQHLLAQRANHTQCTLGPFSSAAACPIVPPACKALILKKCSECVAAFCTRCVLILKKCTYSVHVSRSPACKAFSLSAKNGAKRPHICRKENPYLQKMAP